MAKGKPVLKALPPVKVSKSISMDADIWNSVDALRERIKQLDVPVSFEVHEIIEDAVRDAVAAANAELDRMKPPRGGAAAPAT